MPLMEWKDSFSVKNAQIDEQHKQLIEMLNELHSAMSEGKGADALAKIITEMANYTVEHFKTEENLFQKYGYSGYAEHKKEHDDFVKRVVEFKQELEEKRILLSLTVCSFLRDWLTNHILHTDMKYVDFLNSKGVF